MRVLIIEDNRTSRECLELLLQTHSYWVKSCSSSIEAKKILADTSVPDRIVVDYFMPEETGASFIRFIRDIPAYKDVPVILTTAAGEDIVASLRRELEPYQPVKIVTKPFSVASIMAALE